MPAIEAMNDPALSDPCWSQPPILASGERLAGVRDTRPTEVDKGVLDAKTFDAIETDQLFDSCNHAVTHVGQSVLYRSLGRPVTNAALARKKQGALRELESSPNLREALQHFIEAMATGERSLYELLYGTFTGGLAIDNSRRGKDEMEFSGYAIISSLMGPALRSIWSRQWIHCHSRRVHICGSCLRLFATLGTPASTP
ncbi:MAG: hypothetical protein M3Q16_07230 [Pseudomonadota bacterium]|nr:hypothetical protein [Pseudomonadota bacterium]